MGAVRSQWHENPPLIKGELEVAQFVVFTVSVKKLYTTAAGTVSFVL